MLILHKIPKLAAFALMIVSFGLFAVFVSTINAQLQPATGAAYHALTVLIGFCVLVNFISIAYAHALSRFFAIQEQLVIQSTLAVLALSTLPLETQSLTIHNDSDMPVWELLQVLSRECGFGIMVLLANGYLAWHWSGWLARWNVHKLWYKNMILLGAILVFYSSFLMPPLSYMGRTLTHESNFYGTVSAMRGTDGAPTTMFIDGRPRQIDRSESSPLSDIFTYMERGWRVQTIAVFGMGTGEMNCYRKPWRREYDYFEINPAVADMAEISGHFDYLKACNTPFNVLIGNPLLNIQKQPDERYDLLIIDAFHAKKAPKELLSYTSLGIYAQKMKDNTFIAVNFSENSDLKALITQPMLQKSDAYGSWGLLNLNQRQLDFFQKRGWE